MYAMQRISGCLTPMARFIAGSGTRAS